MKKRIVGIVAEYNPFHNGHKHQLSFAKKSLKAECCVVAMSGNFVQRGSPAIISKEVRANMAVAEGADLVLEIPACFATGSLDDFSLGAVSLLDSLGVITHLLFGSESGDMEPLSLISRAMMADQNAFQSIRTAMRTGMSLSTAMQTNLSEIESEELLQACIRAVHHPNNMLGILYMNALSKLGSEIVPETNKRIGQGYHDNSLFCSSSSSPYVSATAIRQLLVSGCAEKASDISDDIKKCVPDASFHMLNRALGKQRPISENDSWKALCNRLVVCENNITDYRLMTPQIAERITRWWRKCESWNDLVSHVALTDYSPARVNRCLTHIILGITEDKINTFFMNGINFYVKVLARSRNGEELLSEIQRTCRLQVIQSSNDYKLSGVALSQLQIDLAADRVFDDMQSAARY